MRQGRIRHSKSKEEQLLEELRFVTQAPGDKQLWADVQKWRARRTRERGRGMKISGAGRALGASGSCVHTGISKFEESRC